MALLFADGLVDKMWPWKFDVTNVTPSANGQPGSRHAGDSYEPLNLDRTGGPLAVAVNTPTVAFGMAQRGTGSAPIDRRDLLRVYRGGAVLLTLSRRGDSQELFLGQPNWSEQVWDSEPVAASGSDWVSMSMRVHIDGANSTVRVWHGNLFLTEQTLDLGTGNIDQVGIGPGSLGGATTLSAFQDFWVTDGEPLFDARVVSLLANGAGADTDWDPDSETDNFQEVNNYPASGTNPTQISNFAGLVTTELADQRDSHGFENMPTDADRPRVAGVYVNALARKTDEATRKLRASTRIDTTYFDGPEVELTDGNLVRQELLVNPDTTAEWAKSEIDAAEFGFQSRA